VGNLNIIRRCKSQWRGVECDLLDVDGIFIAKGRVIAFNLMEVVFDDQLGEDHVGLRILYCLGIVLVIMMIWKWPLSQTIFNGYSLQEHLMTHNEGHVLDADEVGVVGMKKKYIFFIRGNEVHVTLKV